MANNIYGATVLNGGLAGALDAIDGDILSSGDIAMVATSTGVYHYYLNASSTDSENSPFRIIPDVNPGTKCWNLISSSKVIGALAYNSTPQVLSSGAFIDLLFDTNSYDTGNFHSTTVETNKFIIPVGVSKIIFSASFAISTSFTGDMAFRVIKNADFEVGLPGHWDGGGGFSDPFYSISSAPIDVVANDYFTVSVFLSATESTDAGKTFGCIQAVEFA